MTQIPAKLVIFDCDGVLVNSEPIFNRVLHDYLQNCGAVISYKETCARFTGKNRKVVETYLRQTSLAIPASWPDDFYQIALATLAKEVRPIEGVGALLQALSANGVAICVASNGGMDKMETTLGRVGFLELFQGAMFSAYDIGESKPAPDVFLHAASTLGVTARDCIVVEDSSSGFEAAHRAGMRCFAYLPHGQSMGRQLHSAEPFGRMQDLVALLGL